MVSTSSCQEYMKSSMNAYGCGESRTADVAVCASGAVDPCRTRGAHSHARIKAGAVMAVVECAGFRYPRSFLQGAKSGGEKTCAAVGIDYGSVSGSPFELRSICFLPSMLLAECGVVMQDGLSTRDKQRDRKAEDVGEYCKPQRDVSKTAIVCV